MPGVAAALYSAWAAYLLAFVVSHIRVRLARRSPETRVGKETWSDLGMGLQGIAVFVSFRFTRTHSPSEIVLLAALLLAGLSVGLTWWALLHLGPQWRLRAVVTADHRLVVTGPYRWVRHPVYTAFLGMLVATILLIAAPRAGVAALCLFVIGTEIRIRAEDRLLAQHFPHDFPAYRASVRAWLPLIR